MAREYIRLCWSCYDFVNSHYKLTEEPEAALKRYRCQECSRTGYFSLFSYDPSRPKRDVEGKK